MPQTDVFALKNSGLEAFLFAEVGTDLNGSSLTLLSTLARLGKDPWAQAAEWAGMPVADSILCVTRSIVQMPLCPRALAEARDTSARLVKLLPQQTSTTMRTANRTVSEFRMPDWLPRAAAGIVLALAIAAAVFETAPSTPTIQAPFEQTLGLGR
jgi:hypothetical protein